MKFHERRGREITGLPTLARRSEKRETLTRLGLALFKGKREGTPMPDPSTSAPALFTDDHRKRLRKLRLTDSQVDALEATLPLSRVWLKKTPTMLDVRDELRKVSRPIERAESALLKLIGAGTTAPAKFEAQQRIMEAGIVKNDGPDAASRLLAMAKAVMQYAEPDRKRGPRTSSYLPVARIHQALMRGWRSYRDRAELTGESDFYRDLNPPLVEFNVRLSASPRSAFREIVGICYDAMGFKDADPERAIRNYMALRDKSAKAFPRKAIKTRRRRKRRRMGRQVSKISDMAS